MDKTQALNEGSLGVLGDVREPSPSIRAQRAGFDSICSQEPSKEGLCALFTEERDRRGLAGVGDTRARSGKETRSEEGGRGGALEAEGPT